MNYEQGTCALQGTSTRLGRAIRAIAIVGCAAAALTGCSEETIFSALHVKVTADSGLGVDTLILEVRKVENGGLAFFDSDAAALHRQEISNISLPYTVKLTPGSKISGSAYLVVFGTAGGNRVATWSGVVNLNAEEEVAAHLSAPDPNCDADGDGFKNCSVDGCCVAGVDISDCNDDMPAVSPLTNLPACIPCTQMADLNCDGVVEECNDPDGDDVPACDGDCAPDDGTISPLAAEVCDGKDNDCDGQTDEGTANLDGDAECDEIDADVDGDNFDAVDSDGNVLDCADRDSAINPDAIETCDGVDNNCNGETDEAPECQQWLGDWDGDGKTDGEDCNPLDSRFFKDSTWPACCLSAGYASATAADALAECDFDCSGQANFCPAGDDDGDGVVDVTECPTGQGDPTVYPGATEICGDGIDQDCLGGDLACDSDDADGDKYRSDVDCDDDNDDIHPGAEDVCDGIDNNCDGFTDEGNPGAAGECANPTQDTGVCAEPENRGVQVCAHGLQSAPNWASAQVGDVGTAVICIDYLLPPAVEANCDELDEDCDGQTDEDFEVQLLADSGNLVTHVKGDDCGVGECAGSAVICDSGTASQLACPGFDGKVDELCDNLDNDCDAVTDEFSLPLVMTTCLQAGECGVNAEMVTTLCSDGVWSCDYSGVTTYEGGLETLCDGLDNDCDGTPDEDLKWSGLPFGAPCSGVGECGSAGKPSGSVECSDAAAVATCS
ncbi:MAG: hypothetical protein ACI9OJ_005774, partial [Myxococcota bacterium]